MNVECFVLARFWVFFVCSLCVNLWWIDFSVVLLSFSILNLDGEED